MVAKRYCACCFMELLRPRETKECNAIERREVCGEVFCSALDVEAENRYAAVSFGSTREVKHQESAC